MTAEPIVYFHGAPGAPAELALFGPPPPALIAPDRFVDRPRLAFAGYLDVLADDLRTQAGDGRLRLVGFSAGSRVALEIAFRLGHTVSQIDLIAPAAPLQLGDFLPRMEGRAVFTLARDAPGLFPAVVRLQGALAAFAPRALFDIVFAHPAGEDAALARDPAFAAAAIAMMRRSLGAGAAGYRRELVDFVRPWDDILPRIQAPVRLWQGSVDNWTPPDMARALARVLPGAAPVTLFDDLSHYSTLRRALPLALADAVSPG